MTASKSIILSLTVLLLVACKRFHQLSDKDFAWVPYKGNETLVFTSNTGDNDTIFFIRKDTLIAYPDAQIPFGVTYEVVSIFCKHSDPSPLDKKHRYLQNPFFAVKKGKNAKSELEVRLYAKDAAFYRLSAIRVDSLNEIKPSSFQTQYSYYNDVYEFNGEDYLGFLRDRSNFVTKVYWSKSQGLVRFDKKDTVYWELKNKYSP